MCFSPMAGLYTKYATILQTIITTKTISHIVVKVKIASNQNNTASLAMRDASAVHATFKRKSLNTSGKFLTHVVA